MTDAFGNNPEYAARAGRVLQMRDGRLCAPE